ncbi:hypothetical protein D3C81_1622640 [compost metagenome]
MQFLAAADDAAQQVSEPRGEEAADQCDAGFKQQACAIAPTALFADFQRPFIAAHFDRTGKVAAFQCAGRSGDDIQCAGLRIASAQAVGIAALFHIFKAGIAEGIGEFQRHCGIAPEVGAAVCGFKEYRKLADRTHRSLQQTDRAVEFNHVLVHCRDHFVAIHIGQHIVAQHTAIGSGRFDLADDAIRCQ